MPDAKAKASETKTHVTELAGLIKAYALQETVAPLKTIGRNLAFGAAAALMLGTASVLSLVALLRALQTETGSLFAGEWNWAPYGLTGIAGLVFLGAAGAFMLKKKTKGADL
jgi:hypothetical protein